MSRKLTGPESRYSATEREFLAIVWGVEQFRPYLYGTKFMVRTDHQPLTWEAGVKETSARVTRWKCRLAPYDFVIKYLKGAENGLADCLSRDTAVIAVNAEEESGPDWDPEDFDLGLLDQIDEQGNLSPMSGQSEVREPDVPRRSVEWKDLIINAQKNQLILTNTEGQLRTRVHRYGRKKIVTFEGGMTASEEDIREAMNQIMKREEIWHVYVETEELREKFNRVVEGEWRIEPPELVGCRGKVRTIEEPEQQEQIVRDYHEGETNHRGVRETVAKLRREYFWEDMVRVVSRVLKACAVCKRNKVDRRRVRPEQQHTQTPERPSEIMEADVFTFDGQLYVTVIDRLTKEASAWPVRDKTAASVEGAFRRCFAVVEPPTQLILDRGREFMNERVIDLLRAWRIEPHWTTPGHSPSHGAVERLHATLSEHLLILRQAKEVRGPVAMDLAIHAYNRSIHGSHGMTPWEARRADHEEVALRLQEEKRQRTLVQNVGCEKEPVSVGDVVFRRLCTR